VNKPSIYIAALAQALALGGTAEARQAPTAMRLLPAGDFAAVDGRPGKDTTGGTWTLTAELARKIIAQVAAQRTDVLVDYEHQSLLAKDNGKPAPAAAWLKALEWRDGPADAGGGLWATDVSWTPAAAAALAAGEYRYLSPVFTYDDAGRVTRLVSVALTNTPALDTLDPLVSRAALSLLTGDLEAHDVSTEDKRDQQIAALTQERNTATTQVAALTTQVASLTAERDAAATQLAALKAQADKAQADADKAAHATLLAAALTDGRLTPAQKPWAEKQGLAALTEFLDAAKPLADLTQRQAKAGEDASGASGLNADELAMCTRMGVTAEEFLKAKKDEAKAKA
jgi:phage I-like protein